MPALFNGQQVGTHAKSEQPVQLGIANGGIPIRGAYAPRKNAKEKNLFCLMCDVLSA